MQIEQAEPGGRELHEAQVLVHAMIVIGVEAGALVERLGAVDVGDRNRDQLDLEVHWRVALSVVVDGDDPTSNCGQFPS